jgi:hypothetical protein
MILFIEPNLTIRKRVCDLLPRERILGVSTYNETLEMIAKFRNNFALIIANIRLFKDILLKGTLMRLCQKLYITIPPVIVLYKRGDDKIKEEFEENKLVQKLVKFDSEDNSFPERYLEAVREVYPDVISDMKIAHNNWLKGESDQKPGNVKQWLAQEGFLEVIEGSQLGKVARDMQEVLPLIKKMLAATESDTAKHNSKQKDYEHMYKDLKKKYDLLVNYVKQLAHTTRKDQ